MIVLVSACARQGNSVLVKVVKRSNVVNNVKKWLNVDFMMVVLSDHSNSLSAVHVYSI